MIHEVAVLTPEKVSLSYRVARAGSRIQAHLLDLLIFGALVWVCTFALGALGMEFVVSLLQRFGMFLPFGFFILTEGLWNGNTLGKKAMKIRVVMTDGTPLTFRAAVYRNFLRPADFLPAFYTFGLISMFINPRGQRLGDIAADTMVIHIGNEKPIFEVSPHKMGIHPLEQHVGELRSMSLEEYVALKRLADRFPQLSPQYQAKLLETVWEPFRVRSQISHLDGVHDVYLIEAVVMKFGRLHKLV